MLRHLMIKDTPLPDLFLSRKEDVAPHLSQTASYSPTVTMQMRILYPSEAPPQP